MILNLPADTHIDVTDPAVWRDHSDTLARIHSHIDWWMGDLLANAPDHDSYVELLNADPAIEPSNTSLCELVARALPPARRRPSLPLAYHALVFDFPRTHRRPRRTHAPEPAEVPPARHRHQNRDPTHSDSRGARRGLHHEGRPVNTVIIPDLIVHLQGDHRDLFDFDDYAEQAAILIERSRHGNPAAVETVHRQESTLPASASRGTRKHLSRRCPGRDAP